MANLRILTAALALAAVGAAGTVIADQAADRDTQGKQAPHAQDSQTDNGIGGSAQVPGARDGADKTNPYDDLGPDDSDDDQMDDTPINE